MKKLGNYCISEETAFQVMLIVKHSYTLNEFFSIKVNTFSKSYM